MPDFICKFVQPRARVPAVLFMLISTGNDSEAKAAQEFAADDLCRT